MKGRMDGYMSMHGWDSGCEVGMAACGAHVHKVSCTAMRAWMCVLERMIACRRGKGTAHIADILMSRVADVLIET